MMTAQPAWRERLRALQEASGIPQDGQATRPGYSHWVLQRWKHGEAVPDATEEAAIITLCTEQT